MKTYHIRILYPNGKTGKWHNLGVIMQLETYDAIEKLKKKKKEVKKQLEVLRYGHEIDFFEARNAVSKKKTKKEIIIYFLMQHGLSKEVASTSAIYAMDGFRKSAATEKNRSTHTTNTQINIAFAKLGLNSLHELRVFIENGLEFKL